jgi:glycosyltransferase involved in cell wall biosynthesis
MRVWHVGALHSPHKVNGINAVVWQIAPQQALLGHEVTLLLDDAPDEAALDVARATGLRLLPEAEAGTAVAPDLVHMHSAFIPRQARLAFRLRRNRIPYVVTPHGGVAPQVLRRSPLRKLLYGVLWEKPRFQGAAAVTAVTPAEVREIRAYAGADLRVCQVLNPVIRTTAAARRVASPERPRLVYLGRFDVWHKGLDLLVGLACRLPHCDFHLYGKEDGRTRKDLARLRQEAPPHVAFHPPVYGSDKDRVLREATLYVQTSRWEAFGISVAEAMLQGTPCAVRESMHIADLLQEEGAGFILPADRDESVRYLSEILSDPEGLRQVGDQGQRYAEEAFHPRRIAEQFLKLYAEVATP